MTVIFVLKDHKQTYGLLMEELLFLYVKFSEYYCGFFDMGETSVNSQFNNFRRLLNGFIFRMVYLTEDSYTPFFLCDDNEGLNFSFYHHMMFCCWVDTIVTK